MILHASPDSLNLEEIRSHLGEVPHLLGVHDLHARTVASDSYIVLAHVVVDSVMTWMNNVASATTAER
ncbi:MAG: cation transporter dimerization domain-containing protein [Acidimicrobiales bacterium]